MEVIADIFLIAAAVGAAFYCIVLSRRLHRFSKLEGGIGGAIEGLSEQVTSMTTTLDRAEIEARASATSLEESTRRAEAAARRIELLLACLHDLPKIEPPEEMNSSNSSFIPTFKSRARRRRASEATE